MRDSVGTGGPRHDDAPLAASHALLAVRGSVRRCGQAQWGAGVGGVEGVDRCAALSGTAPSDPKRSAIGSTPGIQMARAGRAMGAGSARPVQKVANR